MQFQLYFLFYIFLKFIKNSRFIIMSYGQLSNRNYEEEYTLRRSSFHENEKVSPNFQKQQVLTDSVVKYDNILMSLTSYDRNYIINLLLEELQQNERLKNELFVANNKLATYEEQQTELKQSILRKRQAFHLISENQQKNMNLIDMLENQLEALRYKYQIGQTHFQYKQGEWEKKYKELNRYTNQYLRNIKEVEEQFKRNYALLKNQNSRLYMKNEQLNSTLNEQGLRNNLISQELAKALRYIKSMQQNFDLAKVKNQKLYNENMALYNQIKESQEKERKLYEGINFIQTQRQQLQRQIIYMKNQFNENEGYSKEIIQRYEDVQNKRRSLEKEKFLEFGKSYQEKIEILENNILKQAEIKEQMRSKLINLEKQNKKLKEEIQQLREEKLEEFEMQRNIQNLITQNENLRDKIRRFEEQYKKQVEKSQLICVEVEKFWKTRSKNSEKILKLHVSNTTINTNNPIPEIKQKKPIGVYKQTQKQNYGANHSSNKSL